MSGYLHGCRLDCLLKTGTMKTTCESSVNISGDIEEDLKRFKQLDQQIWTELLSAVDNNNNSDSVLTTVDLNQSDKNPGCNNQDSGKYNDQVDQIMTNHRKDSAWTGQLPTERIEFKQFVRSVKFDVKQTVFGSKELTTIKRRLNNRNHLRPDPVQFQGLEAVEEWDINHLFPASGEQFYTNLNRIKKGMANGKLYNIGRPTLLSIFGKTIKLVDWSKNSVHNCPLCSFAFKDILDHLEIEHTNSIVNCLFCNQSFISTKDQLSHINNCKDPTNCIQIIETSHQDPVDNENRIISTREGKFGKVKQSIGQTEHAKNCGRTIKTSKRSLLCHSTEIIPISKLETSNSSYPQVESQDRLKNFHQASKFPKLDVVNNSVQQKTNLEPFVLQEELTDESSSSEKSHQNCIGKDKEVITQTDINHEINTIGAKPTLMVFGEKMIRKEGIFCRSIAWPKISFNLTEQIKQLFHSRVESVMKNKPDSNVFNDLNSVTPWDEAELVPTYQELTPDDVKRIKKGMLRGCLYNIDLTVIATVFADIEPITVIGIMGTPRLAYRCPLCLFLSLYQSEIYSHLESNHTMNMLLCTLCNQVLLTFEETKIHRCNNTPTVDYLKLDQF